MQTQVSSTRTATGSSGPVLRALSGTALALALAGGVVLWQDRGQHDERTALTIASGQAEPAAIEHAVNVVGSSAIQAEVQTAALSEVSIIYIVRSEEVAVQFMEDMNALGVAAGQPAGNVMVMVVGSEEEGDQLAARLAQMADARHSLGLLPITVKW